jgi:hypothetical protein
MKLTTTSLFASFMFAVTLGLGGCGDNGGTTETDSSTGTGGNTTDPTGGQALSCDSYCSSITANCKDANSMYADMASCMGACAGFPEGTAADMMGNTLGCRTYHAGAAMSDAATHCTHAGPGGAGACGSNCDGFCAIATTACKTEWPDMASCMTACGGFTDTAAYSAASTSGDSLACRLYHLTVAASSSDNAATHCPHTMAVSDTCK